MSETVSANSEPLVLRRCGKPPSDVLERPFFIPNSDEDLYGTWVKSANMDERLRRDFTKLRKDRDRKYASCEDLKPRDSFADSSDGTVIHTLCRVHYTGFNIKLLDHLKIGRTELFKLDILLDLQTLQDMGKSWKHFGETLFNLTNTELEMIECFSAKLKALPMRIMLEIWYDLHKADSTKYPPPSKHVIIKTLKKIGQQNIIHEMNWRME